jgi:hypothetical protein
MRAKFDNGETIGLRFGAPAMESVTASYNTFEGLVSLNELRAR